MSKHLRVFKIFCFVLAGIFALFCVNIINFVGAESEYDGGTFEDFYSQVVSLYEEYGDVNTGESVVLEKSEVKKDGDELYVSASKISELSGGSGVMVMSENGEGDLVGKTDSSAVEELVAISSTDYILEEDEENYILYEPSYTNRIIVYYEGNLPAYNTDAYAEGLGWHIYQYSSAEDMEEAYNYYDSLSYVDFVEYDEVIVGADTDAEEVSADASSSYLSWGASYTGIDEYLSYLTYIYDESELETVYVPILDSGINTSHELLSSRYSRTYARNFTVTDDYNNIIENTNVSDDEGHGSHTSGIIADQTLDNVILIPCKVLKSNGRGSVSMIVAAIEYIIDLKTNNDLNIRVMNMSLGVESEDGSPVHSSSLEAIMERAYDADIMAVVSAGNSHYNTSSNAPANMYDEVIVVSALEENMFYENGLNIASYSNYGSTVDLSAPGTHIYSSYNCCPRDYEYLDGTSMAAPHVTAAIANLLSNPSLSSLSNDEIENLLFENAIDLGVEGKDIYYGYGCVNIADIGVETIGEVTFSETENMATEPFSLTLSFDYGDIENYQIYYTLDETSPSLDDTLYTGPIALNETTKVTAVAFIFNSEGDIVAKSKVSSMTYYFDNIDLESSFVVSGNSQSGTLSQYVGPLTTLKVPSTIGGVAITNVAEGAFANSKVESVTFESANLILDSYAFYGLTTLTSFKSDGVVSIGSYAFANCTNLSEIEVGNAYFVDSFAFRNCISITDLDLSNARLIGEGALDELSLTSLHLGANLQTFEESYFHANTIYAYSITGFDETLKNYADELILLDMRFTEDYPTRVVFKSSDNHDLTFSYFVNELSRVDYRFAYSNNFEGETISVNHQPTQNLGENLYQTTFTFENLLAGSYSFQFYIYDNYGYVLSSDIINVIVLMGDEEEFSLNYEEGNFEIYIDNVKAENGYVLYGDLTYDIQIVPNASYYISSVMVNGKSVSLNENSFTLENVTRDVDLNISVLEIVDFNISFSVANGVMVFDETGTQLSGSVTSVLRNEDFTFNITVDDAYYVTYVEIDGVRQELKDSYTFSNVLDNHNVEIGTQIKTFVISVNYGAGGTASIQNSERVSYGATETIYLEADDGYEIKSVYVNGEEVEVVNGAITLSNITSDMAITVQFQEESEGLFEGTRLIIFVCFCIAFGILIIVLITSSVKKANKKKKYM